MVFVKPASTFLWLTLIGMSGLTAIAQTATLTASPTALNLSYVRGAALPSALVLSVKASAGTPTYIVTTTGTNTLWLTVTPGAGKAPANLSVRLNPTGLAVGTHTATIVVTAAGIAAPAQIPLTLVVTSPQPTLALSDTTLSFSSPPLQPATQTIRLTTTGGPIAFTAAASGANWMTVSPSAGIVLPGVQLQLTVTVDATSLAPQATPHTGKITIVATGVPATNKTQSVTVTMTANSSTPLIQSLWPPGIQVNSPATTVTIRGTNFYTASVAKIQGVTTPLATTVLSSTALLAVIPANALTTAGTLKLVVSNPAPGGDSLTADFAVTSSPVVQAAVSAASNVVGPVSPGELVTLYGANIGPVTPAGLADTDVDGIADSTVGGVAVKVDGKAAPLLYVSQHQISIQVPYEVTAGIGRAIVVTNGAVTAVGAVDIAAAAPGLFTLDGSGIGQAAALNYNTTTSAYTVNQSSNSAKPGDTVVLYLTGEGDYATSLTPRTGLLIPSSLSPLPQPSPLPTVTIGGVAATVQYAGPLVGSIMGLMQLNVTIPASVTTGTAVPVVVTSLGVASQTGVAVDQTVGGRMSQAGSGSRVGLGVEAVLRAFKFIGAGGIAFQHTDRGARVKPRAAEAAIRRRQVLLHGKEGGQIHGAVFAGEVFFHHGGFVGTLESGLHRFAGYRSAHSACSQIL